MSEPKHVKGLRFRSSKWNQWFPDSKQFTVVFQNVVRDVVENDSILEESVGIVANRQISVKIERFADNGIDYLSLYFRQKKRNDEEGEDMIGAVEPEIVLTVEGNNQIETRIGKGKCTLRSGIGMGFACWKQLNTILDESNGYLKDGTLTVHIEIRIDCLIGKDGIRRFNFHDPFENAFKIYNLFWDTPLYTPKKLFLHHHCHPLQWEPDGLKIEGGADAKPYAEMFLQILNGVRLEEVTLWEAVRLYCLAVSLDTETVIRFCEERVSRDSSYKNLRIALISCTHSKCLLKCMLKDCCDDREAVYKIARTLNHSDEEDVKSEHMKAVVKKLFSFV